MTEADLVRLHEWLHRPHVVAGWGGDHPRARPAEIRDRDLPRIRAQASVTTDIALRGVEPIGYAQSYVALGSGDGWWEGETDPGDCGIDPFPANAADLNLGLGTALVRALVGRLFADPDVTKVQTEPAPDNHRAIRCYEKAGLTRKGQITTPDGPAIDRAITRQTYEAGRGVA